MLAGRAIAGTTLTSPAINTRRSLIRFGLRSLPVLYRASDGRERPLDLLRSYDDVDDKDQELMMIMTMMMMMMMM